MTDDRIEGAEREGVGRVQDALGGLTGAAGLQAEGKVNEAAGGVENAYGKVVDRAARAVEAARTQTEDIYSDFEALVTDHPMAAIGVGVSLGVLFGLLIARGGHD